MTRLFGVVVLAALLGAGLASEAAGNPQKYVAVLLTLNHTKAETASIERQLRADPGASWVGYVSRQEELAALRRFGVSVADVPPSLFSGIVCAIPTGSKAADRLFSSFEIGRRGVRSVKELWGGQVMYPCGLLNPTIARVRGPVITIHAKRTDHRP